MLTTENENEITEFKQLDFDDEEVENVSLFRSEKSAHVDAEADAEADADEDSDSSDIDLNIPMNGKKKTSMFRISEDDGESESDEEEHDGITGNKKKMNNFGFGLFESSQSGIRDDSDSDNKDSDDSVNMNNFLKNMKSQGSLIKAKKKKSKSSKKKSKSKSKNKNFKKEAKKVLSREFIIDSDIDYEGSENERVDDNIEMTSSSASDDDGSSISSDNDNSDSGSNTEDSDSSDNEEESVEGSDSDSVTMSRSISRTRRTKSRESKIRAKSHSKSQSYSSSPSPLKKLTAKKSSKQNDKNMKQLLGESEALMRREVQVELPVEVAKPKSFLNILSEALHLNSNSNSRRSTTGLPQPKQPTSRLAKMLGLDRSEHQTIIPKIGTTELEGELVVIPNDLSLKLTNLPDKHFESLRERPSYMAHVPKYKKSSIEVLNAELQGKISQQSRDQAAYLQNEARKIKGAAVRAAIEKRRKEQEVKKEQELRDRREKKAIGPVFKKYEGIERPEEEELVKSRRARILLSDDSDEDDNENLLNNLNLSDSDVVDEQNEETECNTTDEETDLPVHQGDSEIETELDPAVDSELDSLPLELPSGITTPSAVSTTTTKTAVAILKPLKVDKFVKSRKRSEFLDDEADDEDEEMDAEHIDEEALQREMEESNFITELLDEESGDEDDVRSAYNKKLREADEADLRALRARFGNNGEVEGDSVYTALESKYLKTKNSSHDSASDSRKAPSSALNGMDEELRRLLDPYEQKKRKLNALGGQNLLARVRTVEAASGEFSFKEELQEAERKKAKRFERVFDKNDNKEEEEEHGGAPTRVHNDFNFNNINSSDYYASSCSESEFDSGSDNNDDNEFEGGLYEAIESGLQSRVDEMLDAEAIDVEEVQIQANEALTEHLKDLVKVSKIRIAANDDNQNDRYNEQSTEYKQSNPFNALSNSRSHTAAAGLHVPKYNNNMRAKLMAMQQAEEHTTEDSKKVFKGFVRK